MKIAILGSVDKWQEKFWEKTAKKMGHELDWVRMKNVVIQIDKKNTKVTALLHERKNGKVVDMREYDCILRRWIKKYYTQSLILCSLLQKEGKIVVNSKIDRIQDKITQAFKLRMAGLPHPPTYQALRPKTARKILDRIKYPIILKKLEGAMGKQVYLAKTKSTASRILSREKMYKVLIQEYFPVGEDYRIFVVADRVLGAMKRIAAPGEFRNNVARGAFTEKAELTREMQELALRATKVLDYEIAGVDIIYYKNKPYILEVNRTPQFRGFNKATGINVAEEIIKYFETLYIGARLR